MNGPLTSNPEAAKPFTYDPDNFPQAAPQTTGQQAQDRFIRRIAEAYNANDIETAREIANEIARFGVQFGVLGLVPDDIGFSEDERNALIRFLENHGR